VSAASERHLGRRRTRYPASSFPYSFACHPCHPESGRHSFDHLWRPSA
jgi:hypothetical protein